MISLNQILPLIGNEGGSRAIVSGAASPVRGNPQTALWGTTPVPFIVPPSNRPRRTRCHETRRERQFTGAISPNQTSGRCTVVRSFRLEAVPHCMDAELCFVIMPFATGFDNVFQVLQSVVEDYCGCKCLRADQIATPAQITGEIWERIQNSRFLIADVTGQNPNVFYEVGFAHALQKQVILLVERGDRVPFDIQGIRYLSYDPADLRTLRRQLPLYVKHCLQTIPRQWQTHNPAVRVTHVEWPETGSVGNPLQITAHGRNFGSDAREGYLSVSFPSGASTIRIVRSDLETTVGQKGDSWKNGEVILKYPIAEARIFDPGGLDPWRSRVEHFITVEATPVRRGLIQFYVSLSSRRAGQPLEFDPTQTPLLDQRGEPVYCGIIEVQ